MCGTSASGSGGRCLGVGCDRALWCLVLVREGGSAGFEGVVLELRWRLLRCCVSVASGSVGMFACPAWSDDSVLRFRAPLADFLVVRCAAAALPAVWPESSSNV